MGFFEWRKFSPRSGIYEAWDDVFDVKDDDVIIGADDDDDDDGAMHGGVLYV